jgi:hypothetical protein
MTMNAQPQGQERRKYIRLTSVFPVTFRLTSADGHEYLSDWMLGFTNNISSGGIRLNAGELNDQLIAIIKRGDAAFLLKIQIPLSAKPVFCRARAAWIESESTEPQTYSIGLAYEEIVPEQRKRIVGYAWVKCFVPRIILASFALVLLAFTASGYLNYRLIKVNKAFVNNLVKIVQELSIAKQEVKRIAAEREDLNVRLHDTQVRIKNMDDEKARLEKLITENEVRVKAAEEQKIQAKLKEVNIMIGKLQMDKTSLQDKISNLQKKEGTITEDLLMLTKKKTTLEKLNLDNMYEWLKIHQNVRTGLISSFEGDNDITNWAFTYDQALIVCAYSRFSDFERARKILDFYMFKAKKVDGGFLNAYYATDLEPAEYTVHCGPNIWLGIAIAQYTKLSGDNQYLMMAKQIGNWVMNIQNQDKDGGVRGGPAVMWYATEHNLDAYAFFNMLSELTGEPAYATARDKVLNWLVIHTYDRPDIPVKRGKGDATIATDTYAWSIASIGPDKLEQMGMHPDKIMEFAEQTCMVEVDYGRPDGETVKVRGFDFASCRNVARGGIVSCEWTAQMILSFKLMSKYYLRKAIESKTKVYELKADDYMSQLAKMIISSPSPSGQGQGCLPYATQDMSDTGHGWNTPKGASTGSVSATAYTLFAYYGYNPLELE